MLADDERDARCRTVEEQAIFVQALAAALGGKDGPKQVLDAYQAELRRLRGDPGPARPAPPVAAIMQDPYLAAIGARIARQARRRRKRAEADAAAQAKGTPDGR